MPPPKCAHCCEYGGKTPANLLIKNIVAQYFVMGNIQ